MRRLYALVVCLVAELLTLSLLVGCGATGVVAEVDAVSPAVAVDIPELDLPRAGSEYPASVEYVVSATIAVEAASIPATAPVYEYVDRVPSAEDAARIASELGVNGEASVESGRYWVADGTLKFSMETTTGRWTFIDEERMWTVPPDDPSELPSEDDAVSVASAELGRLGLLADDVIYSHVTNATVSAVGVGEEGAASDPTARVISRQVFFGRLLDGLPVEGPSRIVVGVGSHGDIVGVIMNMKAVSHFKDLPLRSVEEALADVLVGSSQTDIRSEAVRATIDHVHLALYEDTGDGSEQPFLQPVYVFDGTEEDSTTEGMQTRSFTAIVPALAR